MSLEGNSVFRLVTISLLIEILIPCSMLEWYRSDLSRHTHGSGSGSDLVESGDWKHKFHDRECFPTISRCFLGFHLQVSLEINSDWLHYYKDRITLSCAPLTHCFLLSDRCARVCSLTQLRDPWQSALVSRHNCRIKGLYMWTIRCLPFL